jgi:hypothetical protein
MATKNTAIEDMRQKALAMLKKVRELEAKEKEKRYLDLGTLALKFFERKITLDEFKAEGKKLTGLEALGESISNSFSESELENALK